ncbi:hypothetical protein [Tolypothrix sp. VBCCA 56010]|uniref:hypothetical protein n=1 Tax=Tolypothrix sp. VBCCA 56010 TaxID=3137731 RepID=UPI003D7DAB0B
MTSDVYDKPFSIAKTLRVGEACALRLRLGAESARGKPSRSAASPLRASTQLKMLL